MNKQAMVVASLEDLAKLKGWEDLETKSLTPKIVSFYAAKRRKGVFGMTEIETVHVFIGPRGGVSGVWRVIGMGEQETKIEGRGALLMTRRKLGDAR